MADATEKTIADDSAEEPGVCTHCRGTFEHLHVFESRPGVQFCADCAVEVVTTGAYREAP